MNKNICTPHMNACIQVIKHMQACRTERYGWTVYFWIARRLSIQCPHKRLAKIRENIEADTNYRESTIMDQRILNGKEAMRYCQERGVRMGKYDKRGSISVST